MNIHWSDHGLERFWERDGTSAPIDRIKRASRLVEIGEEFHVSNILHTFVCKRLSEVSTVIVTVMFNVSNKPRLPKQKRMNKYDYERVSRKSLER